MDGRFEGWGRWWADGWCVGRAGIQEPGEWYPISTNMEQLSFQFVNQILKFGVFRPKMNWFKKKLVPSFNQEIAGFAWPEVQTMMTSAGASYSTGWKERMVKAWRRQVQKKSVQWSDHKTQCLVLIWLCPEFQEKLESSTRKFELYVKLGEELAKAGFTSTQEQIINNNK